MSTLLKLNPLTGNLYVRNSMIYNILFYLVAVVAGYFIIKEEFNNGKNEHEGQ